MPTKVLIKSHEKVIKLFEYDYHNRKDGSLYLFINDLECYYLGHAKISCHSSGQVNFDMDIKTRVFIDPIYDLKEEFILFKYSIGFLEYSSYNEQVRKKDLLIHTPLSIQSHFSYEITLSPVGVPSKKECIDICSIVFDGLFQLNIRFSSIFYGQQYSRFMKLNSSKHVLPIQKHRAAINYHQKIHQKYDGILYTPNSEGVWVLIHSTPMRVPPSLNVVFRNPLFTSQKIEDQSDEAITKFFVVDLHGNKIKSMVEIDDISLDSELY